MAVRQLQRLGNQTVCVNVHKVRADFRAVK